MFVVYLYGRRISEICYLKIKARDWNSKKDQTQEFMLRFVFYTSSDIN